MRYANIRSLDVTNGEGTGVSLFVQGCNFHCYNCFNIETWDFKKGKYFDEKAKNTILDLVGREYISRFSILGGEPLCDENYNESLNIISLIKKMYPSKKIWVYSGYTYEELVNSNKSEVLNVADVLVDGRYEDSLKDFSLKFRGSSNQRVIDLHKTKKEKRIILYKE